MSKYRIKSGSVLIVSQESKILFTPELHLNSVLTAISISLKLGIRLSCVDAK